MKNFTVVQNTESIKGMHYSFKAENMEEAIKKAPSLVSGEIIEVFETDDLGNRVNVQVRTQLAEGGTKEYKFDKHSVEMYDSKKYTKTHASLEDFLSAFPPNTPSENLLNRIKEEFNKPSGKITYKPKGYKANQTFYFGNEEN